MKRIAMSLIATLALSGAALAQSLPTVSGTVEKVDTAQGKITIDTARSRTSTWNP
jgi:hypothetical protein